MKIASVKIKGFRNFKDANVNFEQKTLLIGPNDIGKSNLLYALRIILDKSLSESDIEPSDSDFYAHEETNDISIVVKFNEITERDDCILAKFKADVSEAGELFIVYSAYRERSGKKSYKFNIGKSEKDLRECHGRWYLQTLNLMYVSSNRDLQSYIKREKRKILEDTKSTRTETQVEEDVKNTSAVKLALENVNKKVASLHYIKSATSKFNEELKQISAHHEDHELVFDAGGADPEKFIKDLQLLDRVSDKIVTVGGDGRNNQIFMAMWAAQHEEVNISEVTFFCIEEPEAHLHPHQQRRLAEYLATKFHSQVILTTHSPQIASEFSPNSIVRLCELGSKTIAANDGCSKIIGDSFYKFGYRMNVLPAEGFFADVVFLVEGATEVMFYKALAEQLNIQLDRENISIISVEGIGFQPYYKLYDSLNIPTVVRTDNDVFKVPKKKAYNCAGAARVFGLLKVSGLLSDRELLELDSEKTILVSLNSKRITDDVKKLLKKWHKKINEANLFLAKKDLERDLLNSPLKKTLYEFCKAETFADALSYMTERKATFIFDFLKKNAEQLALLSTHDIVKPLRRCRSLIRKGACKE